MMGRSPCCDENGLKKGPWTPEEDQKLIDYIQKHGHGSWRALPKLAGLNRCGKSCRLRWTNYLRPDIKRGKFTEEEERIIIHLHSVLGNKWSAIATNLQGRTDNEIKNYWNTHLKKKLLQKGIDPITHRPRTDLSFFANLPQLLTTANLCNLMNPWENALKLQADAAQLAKIQLFNLLQVINSSAPVNMEAFSHLGSTPFQDHHLIAYLQSISQLEGVVNNPLGLAPDPIQMPSSFSNVRLPQPLNDCQTMTDSCVGSQEGLRSNVFNNDNNIICNNNSNRFAIPTVNPIPSSVSALPESSTADQMERKIIPANISAPSATSTTFEAWGELNLDHEASSDYYWTDLSYSID